MEGRNPRFLEEIGSLAVFFSKHKHVTELEIGERNFNLICLPYYEDFTEKYHRWMMNDELCKSVGTEGPMSKEEVESA